MMPPLVKMNDSDRTQAGSVLLELAVAVGILFVLTAAIIDFGLGFESNGGSENAARDLARAGAGHNPNACALSDETLTSCELVCSRATQTLCSYGLNPGGYSVNVHQSTVDPAMLEVVVAKIGGGPVSWMFSTVNTTSAAFSMEKPVVKAGFDSTGCGECALSGCSG